ncbi:hypothetical protein BC833DRAFT_572969 [Globomyces pollinis-pini]|nr:hypothetical protein BC833DRAFT_572969 [Globomyces pollinis-pini]
MECSHFTSDNFKPSLVQQALENYNTVLESGYCSKCKIETESRWICLCCGIISCGRFVKGHAVEHHKESKHTVALDLVSKACHCYVCDEYVYAGALESDLDKLRAIVTDLIAGIDPSNDTEIDLKPHQKIEHITGLENLGNTCYLNCVLQILCHTPPIQLHFLQPLISPILPRKKLLDDANKRSLRSSSETDISLWTSFCSILSKMWDTGEKHISPEPFITNLRQLLPMFKGYQQQDAQELMREMLDLIHTELESRKGKTMIMQMFQGKFLNHVTCQKCKNISTKSELFLDLSLSIPDTPEEEPCTIQQCLELFTAVEELDESEKYMCTPCNKLQSATKQMILCHLPPILCLHLKRFRFMDATRSKISRHVEFPLNNLDMKRYHAPTTASQLEAHPLIYSLYGVIVHIGSSGHGHYIAYILKDHKWYEMNDRKCKVVDVDQVLKQNAYMLFYEVQRNNKRARSLDSNTRPLKAHKSQ